MNYIIDIGSSRTKMALFKGDSLVDSYAMDNHASMADLDRFAGEHAVSAAILSSVADHPPETDAWIMERGGIVLSSDTPLPIEVDYQTPLTLGKDRLAAAVAGHHLYPGDPVLVIDAGTCITCELVTDNTYRGGSISPGISLRFKSMHEHTSHLPYLEPTENMPLIGQNTEESIRSGAVNGAVAELDGMINSYRQQYPDLQVVLTGGDAGLFDKRLKSDIFVAPELVLKGLNIILEHNVRD